MTCRKARYWMGLAAGGDLAAAKMRRLERHLAACAACREEYALLKRSVDMAKSAAREERVPDWSESEWRRVINRAVAQGRPAARPAALRLPRWAWTSAAALLIILVTGGLLFLRHKTGPPQLVEPTPSAGVIQASKPPAVPLKAEPTSGLKKPPAASEPVPLAPGPGKPAAPAAAKPAQTVMAMTFVSQESGLKIYWVFNDAFNYKESEK